MSGWSRPAAYAAFFVCTLSTFAFAQQQGTVFLLNDGTCINAERFETRDGNFLLYIAGNPTPLSYPSAAIKGVNVRCDAPSSGGGQQQASTQFGIHGSNTIGERLMPMLIETYGVKRQAGKPTSKMGASEEQEITVKTRSGGSTVIDLKAHGSGTSAKDLIDGKSIIGMSSRRINPEETAAVQARFGLNPQLPGNEHVLALDGLAVIVNSTNQVKQLNLDQIARIFSGQITNWSELGGFNLPISIYRRDDKSGTTDTFKSLVLAAGKLNFAANAKPFESSETVSSSVADDAGGIGYIALPYINKNVPLAIASSCGITSSPSKFTVKTEEYPLARRLYLYTIGEPSDPIARDLMQFALSDEAQPTVEEAEFVDQRIDLQEEDSQRNWVQDVLANPLKGLLPDREVPREASRAFESMMGSSRRTSIEFRFDSRSAQLDTLARQNVGRLARYLQSPQLAGKRFLIAGFADSKGSWGSNRELGFRRASEVARELEKNGVKVPRDSVTSMSYMAPTACNDSDAGLAKNRRVEIWIAR